LINKLVIENLKHRPVRTALGVLAIGLEVAMMLTLVGVCEGMLEDSARRARGVGADIWVSSSTNAIIGLSTAGMSEKYLDFFRKQPHVVAVMGTVIQPVGGVKTVTGIDLDEFNKISGGFKYLAGGPFRNPDDIIVDEYYARENHLHVGSTVQVLNRPWRVCGIVEPGKLARIVIPRRRLQELTANTGKLSQIWLKLDDPSNTQSVIASLKSQLPGYSIISVEELTSLYSVNNVPGLKAFIGVVITLSIVVGFLVVFLSMYTAVLERTREIGILKALGASSAYVLNVIFRETIMLAFAGTIAGIVLSYGSRWLIMAVVPGSLTQKIIPAWWLVAGGIAVTGALVGAIYPAWKAARQDAIEALSYE